MCGPTRAVPERDVFLIHQDSGEPPFRVQHVHWTLASLKRRSDQRYPSLELARAAVPLGLHRIEATPDEKLCNMLELWH